MEQTKLPDELGVEILPSKEAGQWQDAARHVPRLSFAAHCASWQALPVQPPVWGSPGVPSPEQGGLGV